MEIKGDRESYLPVSRRFLIALQINESIVLPNMDDIPFFDSSSYPSRGGIFAEAGHSHNTAPDPTGEEPDTVAEDITSFTETHTTGSRPNGPSRNNSSLPFREAFSISETFRRRKPSLPGAWIFSTNSNAEGSPEKTATTSEASIPKSPMTDKHAQRVLTTSLSDGG